MVDKQIDVVKTVVETKPVTYGEISKASWDISNGTLTATIVFWESLEAKDAGDPRLVQGVHTMEVTEFPAISDIEASVLSNIDTIIA